MVVAVGRGGNEPVSSSEGIQWASAASFPANPHDNAGPIDAATFWRDRFVLVASGQDFRPSKSTLNGVVWTSADGSTWQLATEITGVYNVTSLVGTPGRLVAGGYMCDSISGPCHARIWATDDLETWTRAEVESASGWMISEVVELDGGFVAIGERPPNEPSAIGVWTSRDGRRWQRREDIPDTRRAAALSIIGTTEGLVAVGGRGERAAVWLSTDGLRWTSVPEQPAFDAGVMTRVTDQGGELIAVGGACDPCLGGYRASPVDPAIWRSIDGLTWTVEHPVFLDTPANVQSMDTLLVRDDRWILATHDWQNQGQEMPISMWVSPPPAG